MESSKEYEKRNAESYPNDIESEEELRHMAEMLESESSALDRLQRLAE